MPHCLQRAGGWLPICDRPPNEAERTRAGRLETLNTPARNSTDSATRNYWEALAFDTAP